MNSYSICYNYNIIIIIIIIIIYKCNENKRRGESYSTFPTPFRVLLMLKQQKK